MLNYETLLSSYDDKLTLMQWLKKVEEALKDASATSFDVIKTGNATLKFSITFEDGSSLVSGEIVLQQGESVASCEIRNGHLFLTLTNGDELDAGAIFVGNVNIAGTLTADSIIENMVGYSFMPSTDAGWTINPVFVGAVKNGNKLTLVFAAEVTHTSGNNLPTLGSINIPSSVASKLTPFQDTTLSVSRSIAVDRAYNEKDIGIFTDKGTNSVRFGLNGANLDLNTQYYIRAEVTFLLGDNLAA